jgi:hypothetical protein
MSILLLKKVIQETSHLYVGLKVKKVNLSNALLFGGDLPTIWYDILS